MVSFFNGTMASNTIIDSLWAIGGKGELVPREYNTIQVEVAEDESIDNFTGGNLWY